MCGSYIDKIYVENPMLRRNKPVVHSMCWNPQRKSCRPSWPKFVLNSLDCFLRCAFHCLHVGIKHACEKWGPDALVDGELGHDCFGTKGIPKLSTMKHMDHAASYLWSSWYQSMTTIRAHQHHRQTLMDNADTPPAESTYLIIKSNRFSNSVLGRLIVEPSAQPTSRNWN